MPDRVISLPLLVSGSSSRDDLIELSNYAWQRFRRRMDGLTDAEYFWEPVRYCRTIRRGPDGRYRSDGPAERGEQRVFTTLAWRLCHIIDVLTEDRTGPWLGQQLLPERDDGEPAGAAEALAELNRAGAHWHTLLAGTTEVSLADQIGPIGGLYEGATRRSFVLHILDELIHHGAEAALLRDLYAASRV